LCVSLTGLAIVSSQIIDGFVDLGGVVANEGQSRLAYDSLFGMLAAGLFLAYVIALVAYASCRTERRSLRWRR
jgi:hypothetical protein